MDAYSRGRSEYSDDRLSDVGIRSQEPVRCVTVGGNLTRIQGSLMELDEVLSMLEKTLSVVLLPDEERAQSDDGAVPSSNQSQLSEQLEMFADHIDRHHRRVSRILARVNL